MSSSLLRRRIAGLRSSRLLTANSTTTSPTASAVRSYATVDPDDEDPQLNGYPRLPNVSRQTLSPYGWDDIQMRRNFGDPLHEKEELYSMWGPDPPPLPPKDALIQLTGALSAFGAFILLIKSFGTPDKPAVPRTYPFSGLVKELGGLEDNMARPFVETGEDE